MTHMVLIHTPMIHSIVIGLNSQFEGNDNYE
jgi:hypothetical protein